MHISLLAIIAIVLILLTKAIRSQNNNGSPRMGGLTSGCLLGMLITIGIVLITGILFLFWRYLL